jgi:2-polyprenyl-6-methoxyphenol hydroxylase-like FAD-dependent oxidoreductase
LIGDAAYTLDPILAQGLGVALEDAHELTTVVDTLAPGAHDEIPGAFAWIARRRRARVRTLARLSALSQWMAHLQRGGAAAAVRDAAMMGAPRVVTCGVFDAALRLSAHRGVAARAGP